eukprot:gnl/MRDRNA2_/MRDRNA2_89278_c0_seq1.p1 gnl/MRDRNA2_/MRDRNA2_89278_c0~~gnl/MRDRNA2_/MRDRNA2_89278_c0_seq1.p1  ORF type:complete len:107 (+),score=27.17 gnl/MRDRNA2_/MRDRNA2_89278_c0_seq1:78-398(+)
MAEKVGIIAIIKIKPGTTKQFEEVFAEMAAGVKEKEPGCLLYQLTRSKSDENEYTVMELYADQKAVADHPKQPHYKEGNKKLGPLLAGKPEVKLVDVVGMSGGSKL